MVSALAALWAELRFGPFGPSEHTAESIHEFQLWVQSWGVVVEFERVRVEATAGHDGLKFSFVVGSKSSSNSTTNFASTHPDPPELRSTQGWLGLHPG